MAKIYKLRRNAEQRAKHAEHHTNIDGLKIDHAETGFGKIYRAFVGAPWRSTLEAALLDAELQAYGRRYRSTHQE
jgi:hypothetical protein